MTHLIFVIPSGTALLLHICPYPPWCGTSAGHRGPQPPPKCVLRSPSAVALIEGLNWNCVAAAMQDLDGTGGLQGLKFSPIGRGMRGLGVIEVFSGTPREGWGKVGAGLKNPMCNYPGGGRVMVLTLYCFQSDSLRPFSFDGQLPKSLSGWGQQGAGGEGRRGGAGEGPLRLRRGTCRGCKASKPSPHPLVVAELLCGYDAGLARAPRQLAGPVCGCTAGHVGADGSLLSSSVLATRGRS